MTREAVVVEAVRTAIGKRGGALAGAHPVDLSAAEIGADPGRLNPLGGAIALGHPLGASGAVLMTRIAHMRDRGLRYGLQTMCEGGGTANATLVELVA